MYIASAYMDAMHVLTQPRTIPKGTLIWGALAIYFLIRVIKSVIDDIKKKK